MNGAFVEIDGKPHVRERHEIRLGLAVDLERGGERALVVPNLRDARRGSTFPPSSRPTTR